MDAIHLVSLYPHFNYLTDTIGSLLLVTGAITTLCSILGFVGAYVKNRNLLTIVSALDTFDEHRPRLTIVETPNRIKCFDHRRIGKSDDH